MFSKNEKPSSIFNFHLSQRFTSRIFILDDFIDRVHNLFDLSFSFFIFLRRVFFTYLSALHFLLLLLLRIFISIHFFIFFEAFAHFSDSSFFILSKFFLTLLSKLSPLLSAILPEKSIDNIWEVRSDGRSDEFIFNSNFNKLPLMISLFIIGKPILQVLSTQTPLWSVGVTLFKGDIFYIFEEDGSGSGNRIVVFIDNNYIFADCYLFVLVQNIGHNVNEV